MKWNEDVIMAVVYFLLGLHSYCLIIFTFGWVLLGIQQSKKELKGVLHSAVLNTVLGIYKLWYGSSVVHVGVSIRSWTGFIMSLVFQSNTTKLDVRHLEYLKTSPMRQYSIVNTFHTYDVSRVPVEHYRTLQVCQSEYS